MTIQKIGRRKKAFLQIRFFGRILPTLGILFCMLLFLRDPTLGREAVLRGLRISAWNVLPSVFPFLVFSDLLISGNALPKGFSKVLQRLFRLPAEGCTAILLGWVCGFPVGARCAATARKNGRLTADQAERTVASDGGSSRTHRCDRLRAVARVSDRRCGRWTVWESFDRFVPLCRGDRLRRYGWYFFGVPRLKKPFGGKCVYRSPFIRSVFDSLDHCRSECGTHGFIPLRLYRVLFGGRCGGHRGLIPLRCA